ncbi:MAG: TraR/DksA C4-type zinc finger protein [Clostridia bacterium]|nr:TraR/DksA C4-type zinc finger protein [Clostridia bacterium]
MENQNQPFDEQDLNHYKHLLDHHKESHMGILDDIENLTLGDNDINETSELSTYDNHPADIATELFDVEHQMALKKLQQHEVNDIELAKAKIKDGTYGLCEGCGKQIDPKRLELLPQAKFCIECAREVDDHVMDMKGEKRNNRPSEEQVLESANINDTTAGEEFYDAVEYGSSDTHQDRGGEIYR